MSKLDINGYRMCYTDLGEGSTIVFIHPPLLTRLNFLYQLRQLSPHFRTIAFDIRGHGQSEASEQELTYSLIVEDIRELIDRLQIEKIFLCGYSTGGSIVLEFLLTYPNRALGGIVISGMSEVSDWRLKSEISLGRSLSQMGAVSAIALPVAWAQVNNQLPMVRLLFNDSKKGNANNIKQYYHYSLQYNCTAKLGNIQQPLMLIYGEKDKLFHPYAGLIRRGTTNSELIYIKDTGHQLPTKAAGKLNGLIKQFLHRYGE